MSKHIQQADKMVSKALNVFNQAVVEVEKSKDILYKGIKQDNDKMTALRQQALNIEAEMMLVEDGRMTKHEKLKSYNLLLEKLKEFVAE